MFWIHYTYLLSPYVWCTDTASCEHHSQLTETFIRLCVRILSILNMELLKKRSHLDKSRTLPEVINALFSFIFDGLCCLKCREDEGHLGFYSWCLLLFVSVLIFFIWVEAIGKTCASLLVQFCLISSDLVQLKNKKIICLISLKGTVHPKMQVLSLV